MTNTAEQWLLDVVAHTDRMVAVAMDELADANEAHWLVHGVMLDAMTDMLGPASRGNLDTALGRALHDHPAKTA